MSDVEDRRAVVTALLDYVQRSPRERLPSWIVSLEEVLGRDEMAFTTQGLVELIDGTVLGLPFHIETNEAFARRLVHLISIAPEISKVLCSDGTVVDFLPTISESERSSICVAVREQYRPKVTVYIDPRWGEATPKRGEQCE